MIAMLQEKNTMLNAKMAFISLLLTEMVKLGVIFRFLGAYL